MPIFESPKLTSLRVTRSASKAQRYVAESVTDGSNSHRRTRRKVAPIIDSDSDTEVFDNTYINKDKLSKTTGLSSTHTNKGKNVKGRYNTIILNDSDSSDTENCNLYVSAYSNNKNVQKGTNSSQAKLSSVSNSKTSQTITYLSQYDNDNSSETEILEKPCENHNEVKDEIVMKGSSHQKLKKQQSCKGNNTNSKTASDKTLVNIPTNEIIIAETRNITPRKKKSFSTNCEYASLNSVTPPKQKKTNENSLFSPSSLFEQLDLNKSPTKNIREPKFEPKKLFDGSDVYRNARKALHSTVPIQMPGREKEHSELHGFIKHHLEHKTSGTLYVSGPPGTGKTASLSTILQQSDIVSEFKEVYVNCTAIKSAGTIYSRILKELGLNSSGKSEKEYVNAIEKYLAKKHKMILLVLDEIDQLESKNQSILYTIFEWPSWPDSKLVLIGIANALDLTDRILPRLQARCSLIPQLMHFAPYTKQQIIDIFTNRLKTAGVLDMFSPVALQMLAGKVAAVSGDVRRALDIGRRVIEIVEKHKKGDALRAIDNVVPQPELTKHNAVDLKHVMDVLNSVYGTSNNLSEESDDAFPLQQKIVVCTLLLILKKARNKDVTIGKLHEVYRKVCTKRNLLAIDQAEFVGLCQLIETKGIIRIHGKKEPRLHKVNLEWDEEEVSAALRDKQLMSTILQDETCLGKM